MNTKCREGLLRSISVAFILLMVGLLAGCGGGGSSPEPTSPPVVGDPGTITVSGSNPRAIRATAYGQNYWDWVYSYSNGTPGTEKLMNQLHVSVYRAGGTYNDNPLKEPWDKTQVDRYIAYCRAIHAEPLFQIPLQPTDTPQQAANRAVNWVNYCKSKGYDVKYWSIGNEPDLYSYYTVEQYNAVFIACAKAIRGLQDANHTYTLFGPDLSWKYLPTDDWLTPFLAACHDYVDIVSVHYYPYGRQGEFTIDNVMHTTYTTRLKMEAAKSIASVYNKPVAMTETHVDYGGITGEAASAETFYAGLWIAETAGIALQEDLWSTDFWCTRGGYGTGFLSLSSSMTPLPSYYALQMFTTHFGSTLIDGVASQIDVEVFASRNAANNRTILIVVNKTDTSWPETIHFQDFGSPLADREYTFPAYSLTCLSIPDDGSPMECWSYVKSLADRRQPPSYQTIN